MRINNNVTALNAHRMYSNNNSSVTKSVSKLSSGYRINSAADDAAGLAISEKMRAQIRGLTMASKNSQDAVSLVQTAEGALQETHNILQRMRELAVQSASDTNETSIDRSALNAEFQQLKKEIDDIADKTRFNDQNLIDGTFSSYKASASTSSTSVNSILTGNARGGTYALTSSVRLVGAEAGAAPTFSTAVSKANNVSSAVFTAKGLASANTTMFNKDFTLNFKEVDKDGIAHFTLTAQDGTKFSGTATILNGASNKNQISIGFGSVGTLLVTTTSPITGIPAASTTVTVATAAITQAAQGLAGMTLTGIGGERQVEGTPKAYLKLGEEEVEVFAGDKEIEFRSAGVTLVLNKALTSADLFSANISAAGKTHTKITGFNAATPDKVTVKEVKGQSLVIQTGANEGDNLAINLDKMNTNMLGIYTTGISTRQKASEAITFVNNATNIVSTQRAELGALANRLEHKIANLDTSAENLQAAESRIRDVDMAKEMTSFTKNNILAQASTAMLAQANALPQGVLQLLG